jgi:hypothetical protein
MFMIIFTASVCNRNLCYFVYLLNTPQNVHIIYRTNYRIQICNSMLEQTLIIPKLLP